MPQTTPWSPEEPAKEVCDDRMERSLYHRGVESWPRESAPDAKWSFCLTAGTLCAANQERP